MLQSLAELQQRREATAQRIAQLGDFRPGSITNTSGRCGKPSCHCHQAGQPGHGPNLRLTYKADGKTISESLPSPAAIHKAEICHLRPAAEEPQTDQEKKRSKPSRRKSRAK